MNYMIFFNYRENCGDLSGVINDYVKSLKDAEDIGIVPAKMEKCGITVFTEKFEKSCRLIKFIERIDGSELCMRCEK